jgi:hypothetical protein
MGSSSDILARLAERGIRPLRHPRLQPGAPGEHRARCPECNRAPTKHDDALAVKIEPDGGALLLELAAARARS